MKKDRLQSLVLEQLRKIPIVHVVAEKVSVSRSTIYRWKDESEQFRKDFEAALCEGEEFISDMAESQLINLMKDKHWPSIRFWLERRSEKFRNKLEVSGGLQMPQEELSPEQEAIVREALRLAHLTINKETNDYDQHNSE